MIGITEEKGVLRFQGVLGTVGVWGGPLLVFRNVKTWCVKTCFTGDSGFIPALCRSSPEAINCGLDGRGAVARGVSVNRAAPPLPYSL